MGSRKTRSMSSGYSGGSIRGYKYANRRRISQADRNKYPALDKLSKERKTTTSQYQSSLGSFSSDLAKNATKSYILHNYPIFGDLYYAYRFSKCAYEFTVKVQKEHNQNGGDLQQAVGTVASSEKDRFIETAKDATMDYVTRSLWNQYKEDNDIETKNSVFDDLVQGAMSETLQEMVGA